MTKILFPNSTTVLAALKNRRRPLHLIKYLIQVQVSLPFTVGLFESDENKVHALHGIHLSLKIFFFFTAMVLFSLFVSFWATYLLT